LIAADKLRVPQDDRQLHRLVSWWLKSTGLGALMPEDSDFAPGHSALSNSVPSHPFSCLMNSRGSIGSFAGSTRHRPAATEGGRMTSGRLLEP